MPLTRRPRPSQNESEVQALIEKGGSVPNKPAASTKPFTALLRFTDRALLERVDRAVAEHQVKISRNTWIHYAITEKLERDGF